MMTMQFSLYFHPNIDMKTNLISTVSVEDQINISYVTFRCQYRCYTVYLMSLYESIQQSHFG